MGQLFITHSCQYKCYYLIMEAHSKLLSNIIHQLKLTDLQATSDYNKNSINHENSSTLT